MQVIYVMKSLGVCVCATIEQAQFGTLD